MNKMIIYTTENEDEYTKNKVRICYQKDRVSDPPGQHMLILRDCMELLNKTINPGTYFYRESLALEEALYCYREPNEIWNGMKCKQIYHLLYDREKKKGFDKIFIDRLFEKGREDSLVYQMNEVSDNILDETLNYFINRLNGKKYLFCKVNVSETNDLTTYVTKDKSIKEGDLVSVPVGDAAPDTSLRIVQECFEAAIDEIDIPIKKLRCVEEKFKNIKCPNCGANIEADIGSRKGRCKYCQAFFYVL